MPIYPATAGTSATIWIQTTATSTTAATTGMVAWPAWQDCTTINPYWTSSAASYYQNVWQEPRQLDPALEAKRAIDRQRSQARRLRATRRARRLLLRILTVEQQAEYAQAKAFTVHAADGRTFRLRKGRTAELLGGDGNPVAAYCIHLPGGFVAEDSLVAQILTLQTDPSEFERIANVTRLVGTRG